MQSFSRTLAVVIGLLVFAHPVVAQTERKDEFFWLGEINKATAVINTDEGCWTRRCAAHGLPGIAKVMKDGNQPGGKRPTIVITFEPLLIDAAGPRSPAACGPLQPGHARHLSRRHPARRHAEPGRPAEQDHGSLVQPGRQASRHHRAQLHQRRGGPAQQLRPLPAWALRAGWTATPSASAKPMPASTAHRWAPRCSTAPAGRSIARAWPDYLGFAATVDNAYDAAQISSVDEPVEVGAIVTSIGLHTGHFIEDLMTQYAQARPWILLQEGGANTYVSQRHAAEAQPRLLNHATRSVDRPSTLGSGVVIMAHNITPGMEDPKEDQSQQRHGQQCHHRVLNNWDQILKAW
jgi:argininosuccinate lyase